MEKIFQVSEFNEFISIYLNQVGSVTVEGEISDIKISQNKWLFITIKDKNASVDIFGTIYQIPSYDILEVGMLVHVIGIPTIYQKTGRFSVTASHIKPAGDGSIKLAFEKLKIKLEKEGLFDISRKRELPEFPQKVALITGKDSQAYNDFIKISNARTGSVKILFFPTLVQGVNSSENIVNTIKYINTNYSDTDVLVITRGGGSIEDLQSFNDENVVRAIFSSKIPTVTGVGHEGDYTLSDYVSDLRASTPSNASELIFFDKVSINKQIDYMTQINFKRINQCITDMDSKINSYSNLFYNQLLKHTKYFSNLTKKLISNADNLQNYIQYRIEKIQNISSNMTNNLNNNIVMKNQKINFLTKLINANDYKKIMQKGYSITRDHTGKIIKSSKYLKIGEINSTELNDGKFISKIIKLENEDK